MDSPPAPPPTGLPEADLARHFNVSRADLKKLREQLAPSHFVAKNGAPVLITPDGQELLARLLQNPAAAASGARPALPARVPDHYVTLRIVRILPRMLLARKTDAPDGPTVRVKVKAIDHFRPGMLLPKCQASGDFPDLYYYHGRQPRWNGERLVPR